MRMKLPEHVAILMSGLIGLAACSGCGTPSGTVPVSGVIFVDGQPLPGAGVFYIADDFLAADPTIPARPAHGTTDAEGRYALYPGVFPGGYRVIVRGFRGGQPERLVPGFGSDGVDEGQLAAAASARSRNTDAGRRNSRTAADTGSLPHIYTSTEQTVLRIDVPEGGTTTADLHLALEMLAEGDLAVDAGGGTGRH